MTGWPPRPMAVAREALVDDGRILFDAVTGHFHGDPDTACHYLIDRHPVGWSVLGGDFTAPPGYRTGHHPRTGATSATATATATNHPTTTHRPHRPRRPHRLRLRARACPAAGPHQPPRQLAAGRRTGLDRQSRLERHRPARPTAAPRLVAPDHRPDRLIGRHTNPCPTGPGADGGPKPVHRNPTPAQRTDPAPPSPAWRCAQAMISSTTSVLASAYCCTYRQSRCASSCLTRW
jgi:hypothetical protein